jgi:glutamyl-tRNA synthetase
VREAQAKRGQPTLYDRTCTRLPPGEADRRASAGEPHVVRLFVPPGATAVDDAVVGEVRFGHAVVDDAVLLKSDG